MMASTSSQEVMTSRLLSMTWKEESKFTNSILLNSKTDSAFIVSHRKINTYYNKNYGVDLVRFTHHNKCILCASKRENQYRIMYWSLHDNNILCSFLGHNDVITNIDLNPQDASFLSVSQDGTTRVWEYQKKQCLIKFNRSKTACFDNMGKLLACLFVRPNNQPIAMNQKKDEG